MCWADVQINRRQYVNSRKLVTPDGASATLFPPNPYRQRILIAQGATTLQLVNLVGSIFAGPALAEYVIGGFTGAGPYVFDIADIGADLQGPLSIVVMDPDAIIGQAIAVEICLNDPLELGVI